MQKDTVNRVRDLIEAANELDIITARINRQVLELYNSRQQNNVSEPTEDNVPEAETIGVIKLGELSYKATPEFLADLAKMFEMLAGTVSNAVADFYSQNPARRVALYETFCDVVATMLAQFEGANIPALNDVGYSYSERFDRHLRNYSQATASAVRLVVERYPELAEAKLAEMRPSKY